MEIKISTIENGNKVQIIGELDLSNSDKVQKTLLAGIDKSAKSVILDLEKISFIDSTGIRILVNIRKHFIENGISLTLINLPANILDIFKLAHLDKYFTIEM